MTSRITVDAHAGWPIEVKVRNFTETNGTSGPYPVKWKDIKISTYVVAPGTQQDFSIWDGCEIISIIELKKD